MSPLPPFYVAPKPDVVVNNLSFKLVRKQFFCANCGVFVSKEDEHCPHCGRLFLEAV